MNRRLGWFLAGGVLVALLLAGVVGNFASSSPDGLDATTLRGCTVDATGKITGGQCPAQQAQDHQLADGPLANYGIKGLANPRLSTGLAGVAGVLVTFGLGAGLFWVLRRRGAKDSDATEATEATDASAPDASAASTVDAPTVDAAADGGG